jgi:hypothetical protein
MGFGPRTDHKPAVRFEIQILGHRAIARREDDVVGGPLELRMDPENDTIQGENSDFEKVKLDDIVGNQRREDVGKVGLDREELRIGAEMEV